MSASQRLRRLAGGEDLDQVGVDLPDDGRRGAGRGDQTVPAADLEGLEKVLAEQKSGETVAV